MNEQELREKVAEAIWDASESAPLKWKQLDPKIDKSLKREILQMADAAIRVLSAHHAGNN